MKYKELDYNEFATKVLEETTDMLDVCWFNTELEYSTYINGIQTAHEILGAPNSELYKLEAELIELGKNSIQKIYTPYFINEYSKAYPKEGEQ